MKLITFLIAALTMMAQDKDGRQSENIGINVDGNTPVCELSRWGGYDGKQWYLQCTGNYSLLLPVLSFVGGKAGGDGSSSGSNLMHRSKRYRVCWFTPPDGRVSCSPLFGFARAKAMAKGIDRSFIDEAVK